jgi:hypothetical protein
MRLKSFVWFAVSVVVILLLLAAARKEGGGFMTDWLAKIHGR